MKKNQYYYYVFVIFSQNLFAQHNPTLSNHTDSKSNKEIKNKTVIYSLNVKHYNYAVRAGKKSKV
jgi:hypothetical protein